MKGIKQALLVMGSAVALIIAALAIWFAWTYPSILSVLLFVIVVPVFSMLGLGLFKIAREEHLKSRQARTEAAN
jgi:uncharacterized protein YacL